jgi:flap endonuclease-1
VWGVGSEDMDTLAFGCPRLLRHVTASEAQKLEVAEFDLQVLLESLAIDKNAFIDLCILLGCDYCETIRGIGPKRALELIRQFGTIEAILEHLPQSKIKFEVPNEFLFERARREFTNPDVTIDTMSLSLSPKPVDEEGLLKFMVTDRGFSQERIQNGINKITQARKKGTQARIDSFFGKKDASK